MQCLAEYYFWFNKHTTFKRKRVYYLILLRKYISIITLITFVIPFIFIVPVFSIHVVDSSLFALLCVVLSTFFVPSRHKLEPSILEALWGSPPQTRNKVIWRSLTWSFFPLTWKTLYGGLLRLTLMVLFMHWTRYILHHYEACIYSSSFT